MPDAEELKAPATANTRLPGLDGLRAMAILMVILAHAFSPKEFPPELGWLKWILVKGGVGVQIFFTLSGFLITTLLLDEKAQAGRIDLRAFYARRLGRICPASYLYLAVLGALIFTGVLATSGRDLSAAALYILNYRGLWAPEEGAGYWFVAHFWTLSTEQQFYFLWPLAVMGLALGNVTRLAALLVIAIPTLRLAHYHAFPALRPQIGMFFHTGSDCIFIGALAAALCKSNWNLGDRIASLNWRWSIPTAAFLLTGSLVARRFIGEAWQVTLSRPAIGVASAILMLWIIENPRSMAGRFLTWKPVAYLGMVSYGLFIWQQLFLAGARELNLPMIFARIACAVIVAIVSYELMEKRINAWTRKNFPRASAPSANTKPTAVTA